MENIWQMLSEKVYFGRQFNNKELTTSIVTAKDFLIQNKKETIQGLFDNWILHDDNAPSHRAAMMTEFKAKTATNTIYQLPHSPDLAPYDIFLFPKLKLPF